MDLRYVVTYELLNKIYFAISDQYGWEEVPYEYSSGGFKDNTIKIEIPMWRYDTEFMKKLFLDNDLTILEFTKDDVIWLDSHDDYYNIKVEKDGK